MIPSSRPTYFSSNDERARKRERESAVEQRETEAKREKESRREDPEDEAAAEKEDEGGEKEGR